MTDDDITNHEWNVLMRWLKAKGMTAARATAYLNALIDFCEKAKEKHARPDAE